MEVSKWENSLAVRLLATIIQMLNLKEGDQIEISVAGERYIKVAKDRSREKALEAIRRLARPLPAGFRFDREEANQL
jgi:antitoxin MazE